MGDIADMTLDGVLCQYCGVYIGKGNGYPESCGCHEEDDDEQLLLERRLTSIF